MGIDLAGATLITSAGGLAATFGPQIMKLGPSGILQRYNPGQPMFCAGGSGAPAWVASGPVNTWYRMVLDATNVNIAGCYSGGRFTAPVTGIYLMVASSYYQGAVAGWYVHPLFWVNGGSNTRRPDNPYRIRGHGNAASFETDTDSLEIIPLIASDYVEFYNFSGGGANQYIPQYSRFEGYLLC
jgi:hypothetical protein